MKHLHIKHIPLDGFQNYRGLKGVIEILPSDSDDDIIQKLSKVKLKGCSNHAKRWMKHLSEYNSSIERISGTFVTAAILYVERDIEEEVDLYWNSKNISINPDDLDFDISDEDIISLMSDSHYYANEINDEECDNYTQSRRISVKRASNVPLCDECNGTGEVACPHCDGTGEVRCYSCLGTGEGRTHKEVVGTEVYYESGQRRERPRYSIRVSQCTKCYGRGYIVCSNCHGRRYLKCEDCHGTGRMEGAKKAWDCKYLKETFRLYKDSIIMFNNNDILNIDFHSLIPPEEGDVVEIYHNIIEGKPHSLRTTGHDEQLISAINDYCLYCVNDEYLNDNQYHVGVAIRACNLPSVYKISVIFDNTTTVMYIIDKYLIMGYGNVIPEMSLVNSVLRSLRRFINKSRNDC